MGRGDERRKGEWVRREAEKHGKKADFRAEGISCFGRGEHLPMDAGSISLWTEGTYPFGHREDHDSSGGEHLPMDTGSVMLRTKGRQFF